MISKHGIQFFLNLSNNKVCFIATCLCVRIGAACSGFFLILVFTPVNID